MILGGGWCECHNAEVGDDQEARRWWWWLRVVERESKRNRDQREKWEIFLYYFNVWYGKIKFGMLGVL